MDTSNDLADDRQPLAVVAFKELPAAIENELVKVQRHIDVAIHLMISFRRIEPSAIGHARLNTIEDALYRCYAVLVDDVANNFDELLKTGGRTDIWDDKPIS